MKDSNTFWGISMFLIEILPKDLTGTNMVRYQKMVFIPEEQYARNLKDFSFHCVEHVPVVHDFVQFSLVVYQILPDVFGEFP